MSPGPRRRLPGVTDLGLLDALCRRALAARRCGAAYQVTIRDEGLRRLAVLTGLAGPLRSGQVQGQPESGEDRLAEEGVDVADPST